MMKKIFVLLIILVIIPSSSLAVSWHDIMNGILNNNVYTYTGGQATVSGDTILIKGGSVEDVQIYWHETNPNPQINTYRFEGVSITGEDCFVSSDLASKSVYFDQNTSIITETIGFSASGSGSLTVKSDASLSGKDFTFVSAFQNGEISFTNNGEIVSGIFHIVSEDHGKIVINQDGVFTANGEIRKFHLSANDNSQIIASNTGTINGDYSGQTSENGTLTMKNSGHVSGKYSFLATDNGNNMTFEHTGSVDKGIRIFLEGTHTLQYRNTGSAKEELYLEIWGDSSIKGTHNPTANTPEVCRVRLYPYYTITTAEKALEKAETIVLNLKKMGIITGGTTPNTYYRYKDSGVINNIDDYRNCGWIEYKYILGDNNLTFNGTDSLTFGIDAPYSLLLGVYVDDVPLSKGDYSAWEGSTYIKLNPSYLSTLSAGKHTLSVMYPFGFADTTFTIYGEINLPQTGDTSLATFWCVLLMVSLITIVLLSRKKTSDN